MATGISGNLVDLANQSITSSYSSGASGGYDNLDNLSASARSTAAGYDDSDSILAVVSSSSAFTFLGTNLDYGITAGVSYTLSARIKARDNGRNVSVSIQWFNNAYANEFSTSSATAVNTSTFTSVSVTATAPADIGGSGPATGCAIYVLWLESGQAVASDGFYVDFVCLRTSSTIPSLDQAIGPTGPTVAVTAGTVTVVANGGTQNITPAGPTVSITAGTATVERASLGVPGVAARSITTVELIEARNVGQIRSKVRWDVLDRHGNLTGELHPVRGTASVEWDADAEVKRRVTGLVLSPSDEAALDIYQDLIRPVWVYPETGDEFPLGVFEMAHAPRQRKTSGLWLTGTLFDQSVALRDGGAPHPIGHPAGTLLTDALRQVFVEAGFPYVVIDASSRRSPVAFGWEVGTTWWERAMSLCEPLGFVSPYWDNDGIPICRKFRSPLDTITADHTYSNGAASRIIRGTIEEDDDRLELANRFVAFNPSPLDDPIGAYWDVPDAAPHSFRNRGRRIVRRIEDSSLEDGNAAYELARATGMAQHGATQWASFSAAPDPRHDGHAIVNLFGTNYREQSWSLRCTPAGPHRHEVRREV